MEEWTDRPDTQEYKWPLYVCNLFAIQGEKVRKVYESSLIRKRSELTRCPALRSLGHVISSDRFAA